ncbi:MAG: thymidylate synthase [Bacilli bacterium]|nr:thymidylate synthase [Bacilli bacterium]
MIINGKEIKIDRSKVRISEMDRAYCELVQNILDNGIQTNNRTGIDTLSIAGWNYKFDVGSEFPIAETKDVKIKNCTSEIQWIHTVQDNHPSWLRERDNNTWNLWEVDDDGIYRIYEQGENAVNDPERTVPLMEQVRNPITGVIETIPFLDKYGKQVMVKSKDVMENKDDPRTIKQAIWFGKKYARSIGEAYGFINDLYKKPQSVEWTLKNNPTDRRMNIVLWQDYHIEKAVLPSCVWSSEYKVTPDGRLHAYVHQRSADVPLGLPFNITQYAILLSMFAKVTGYEVGTMSWSIMDAHIYVNQLEGIKKQLRRYEQMTKQVEMIHKSSDVEVEDYYNKVTKYNNKLHDIVSTTLNKHLTGKSEFIVNGVQLTTDDIPMSKRVNLLKTLDLENLAKDYENSFEEKVCFEHLVTRDEPVLELEKHDSIFDYSTDFASKNDPYLKENPVGNKEIVLKKYKPTPFIKMPIAQ